MGVFEANIELQKKEMQDGVTQVSSKPTAWAIPAGDKCNLKCFICSIGVDPNSFQINLPATFYEQTISFLPYINNITLNGAELFFYKEGAGVYKFLSLGKEYPQLKLSGITNATLMNKEKAKLCFETFRAINISIDSPKPDIYESIRIGANFKKTIQNVEYLKELKSKAGRGRGDYPVIEFNYIIMDRTYKDILEFFELAKGLGAKRIQFSPLRIEIRGEAKDNLIKEDIFHREPKRSVRGLFRRVRKTQPDKNKTKVKEYLSLMSEVRERAKEHNIAIVDRCLHKIKKAWPELCAEQDTLTSKTPDKTKGGSFDTRVCKKAWDGFFIWPNGNVSFCCGSIKIGNLHNSTIDEIWNSAKAQRERKNFIGGNYSNCIGAQCPIGLHNFIRKY